jgi:hypothetical protein
VVVGLPTDKLANPTSVSLCIVKSTNIKVFFFFFFFFFFQLGVAFVLIDQ